MLDEVVLLARLILAGIFLVSGVAKLTDRAGTREAARAFGVPEAHAPVVAVVLPPAEIALAVLLLPAGTARVAAAGALLLLAAFTAAVVWSLRQGRRPQCHCFGRIGTSDVSGRTVVRNAGLTALATLVLLAPGEAVHEVVAYGPATFGVLLAAALASVLAIVTAEAQAARNAGALLQTSADRRFDADLASTETARGTAPAFALPSLAGSIVSLAGLLDSGRPLLLVFLSPGCGPCRRLRPLVSRWGETFSDRLRIAVVVNGTAEANARAFSQTAVPVLLDEDRAVSLRYEIPSRPAGVLIDPSGSLLGPVATGDRNLRELVAAVLSGRFDSATPHEDVPAEVLSLSSAPRPRVSVTAAGGRGAGEVVVTDEVSGASASLDALGWLVWQCLDGRTPLQQIVQELAEAFGASAEVVGDDVMGLMRQVGRLGLLEGFAAAAEQTVDAEPSADAHAVSA